MSDFVFVLDEAEALKASTGAGGKFGTLETDMYDVTITTATLGKTKGGNNVLDLSIVTEDGHETTIYQAFALDPKWTSGAENFGYKTWQAFIVATGIKGMTTFQKPLLKEDGSAVIKNGSPIVLNAVKELEGAKVTLAIVKALDYHKGEVTEDNEVFASFRTSDKASSKEILTGTGIGGTYEKMKGILSDKHEKAYKAYKADGGSDVSVDAEAESAVEDLGL